jgi:hypothetical protein
MIGNSSSCAIYYSVTLPGGVSPKSIARRTETVELDPDNRAEPEAEGGTGVPREVEPGTAAEHAVGSGRWALWIVRR